MNYPRKVYAIFPFGSDGKVCGVYVGSAHDVESRISQHLSDYCGHYGARDKELHDLMRQNGFDVVTLGDINNETERHLEYDWIQYFYRSKYELFNTRMGWSLKPDATIPFYHVLWLKSKGKWNY